MAYSTKNFIIKTIMITNKMPLENENEPSCLGAVNGSTSLFNWIPTNSEQCKLHKPETCFVADKKGNVLIDNYHNGIENWFKSEYSHYIIITYPDAPYL